MSSDEPTTVYVVTYPTGSFCGIWSDRDTAERYAKEVGGHCDAHPVWEAEEPECQHKRVEKDDDGRDRWFYVCLDCDEVVELSDPDEDGKSYWEVVE